jgi:3-methyl-2-oxobutanoate hydroxymethyltransferase
MSDGAVTVPSLRVRKRRHGATPIVMVTAYDEPGARIVSDAGADIILVGDSVANTVLGYPDTLHVDIDVMAHHTAAVARAAPHCLILGDMPWMSYHLSADEAVRNAATLIRAGAQAVKLEGGRARLPVVEAIIRAEIPVMGHLGLTPQSVLAMGGFRVQGKSVDAASALLDAAKALSAAGCFAFVIEGVPDVVGAAVTEHLDVPTIGIGAGPACDGQVLVFHDLLGLGKGTPPKFVRRYADLGRVATEAVAAFAEDVRSGSFPSDAESYHAPKGLGDALLLTVRSPGTPGPEGGTPHMRPYEVMAIFEATTEPTVIQGVLDQALDVIRTTGGTPGAIDRWGKRTFAYEVNHKREGYYVVVEFTAEPETVAALDRMLGLADEVVRHKVVRLPDQAATASTAAPAAS